MTEWREGMRALIVEHDPVTREPKPGGFCYPAWVSLEGPYVYGHRTDPGDTSGLPYRFMADTGWGALDGYDIRLLPVTGEEAATAAGEGG